MQKKVLVAEQDITVWKVLEEHKRKKVITMTPYRYMEVPLHVLNGETPLVAKGKESVRESDGLNGTIIEGGFIHSFSDRDVAMGKMRYLQDLNDTAVAYEKVQVVVYECVIPKGTKYYVGLSNDIASKQIMFRKKIS